MLIIWTFTTYFKVIFKEPRLFSMVNTQTTLAEFYVYKFTVMIYEITIFTNSIQNKTTAAKCP